MVTWLMQTGMQQFLSRQTADDNGAAGNLRYGRLRFMNGGTTASITGGTVTVRDFQSIPTKASSTVTAPANASTVTTAPDRLLA
jgi:hypothetical protein